MNIGIVGLGLIGGSLGKAMVKKTEHTVYGYDIFPEVMLKGGLINAYHYELTEDDYCKLDILIIATYPRAFKSVLNDALPRLKDNALVMDIGGNKKSVVEVMEKARMDYPNISFIATHPMAGREYYGINHSMATLFEKASILIIPVHNEMEQLVMAKNLFAEIGFTSIIVTDWQEHDKMIAYTSQLAHIVSSSYVKNELAENHDGFSAGSFKDLTRVAKLNPVMWSELMLDNKDNLICALDNLLENLNEYKKALIENNEGELIRLLKEGNEKKEIIEKATREWKKNQ